MLRTSSCLGEPADVHIPGLSRRGWRKPSDLDPDFADACGGRGETADSSRGGARSTRSDGVSIRCSYYPGGFIENLKTKEVTAVPGTEVIPILMLHGWDGQRTEYDFTASFLQRLGHAVLVPDLRGHGESLVRRQGAREIQIDRGELSTPEIKSMVLDIEACKRFLLERNNAEELNIELLCVVGAEFGATLAVNWAVMDWSWPQLPAYKQGRDVKSLVLLSPVQAFKGVTLNDALKHRSSAPGSTS